MWAMINILRDMYAERIEGFRALLSEIRPLDDRISLYAQEALSEIMRADRAIDSIRINPQDIRNEFRQYVESELDRFADVLDERDDLEILQWIASITSAIAECFDRVTSEYRLNEENVEELQTGREIMQSLSQRALVLADSERIRSKLAEADHFVKGIKEQAGVAGETANLKFYGDFANAELKAARRFRVASIVLITATIAIAVFYAVWESLFPPPEPDWTAVVYRTAILVGIGALSAYLARQAGQHRRLYNWANALEVQLQSFQNFIAPMTDEERREVRLNFARRVLGSPPDPKTGESSDDTVPTAQLLDIAAAAIRRGATP